MLKCAIKMDVHNADGFAIRNPTAYFHVDSKDKAYKRVAVKDITSAQLTPDERDAYMLASQLILLENLR